MTTPQSERAIRVSVFLNPDEFERLNRITGADQEVNAKGAGVRRSTHLRESIRQSEVLLLRDEELAALREVAGVEPDAEPDQWVLDLCSAFVRNAIYQARDTK